MFNSTDPRKASSFLIRVSSDVHRASWQWSKARGSGRDTWWWLPLGQSRGMASPSARQENPDGSPELFFSLSASVSFSWFLKKTGIYKDIKNIHPKLLMERRNLSEITKRLLGMGWSSNPA